MDHDQQPKDTFYIIISIPKWKQLPNSQIEYSLQLFSELTNKTWEVTKTLNEIDKYNQYLLQAYSDLPVFPDINYAILNLQKTKVLINLYLTQILNRSDIISNPETDNFFILSNHLSNMKTTQPFCLGIDDEKEQRTSIICYSDKMNIFILGYSAKNDISSLLTTSAMSTELVVKKYNMQNRKMETISQTKVKAQITIINFVNSSNLNFVLVGLINGTIQLYNIMQLNSTKITLEKMSEVKVYNTKILNFGFNALSGYIYSSSINDNAITISEVNYEKVISTLKISNSILTAFAYDDEKKIIIIADFTCSISIFQVQNSVSFVMLQAFHGTNGKLIDFTYDASMCKFFVSNTNSELSVYYYNILLNKIDKIADLVVDKGKRYKITGVAYRKYKKELIISLSNGKIQFWSHNSDYPEYVIDCCANHFQGIKYIEQGDMMISNCGEAMKKYWLLPEVWPGEQMRKNENSIFDKKKETEIKNEKEEVICRIEESNNMSEDEDSSYLDGWDCDIVQEEVNIPELILPMMF